MAQRKRDERSPLVGRNARPRLDEDGFECPGPHADVIFELASPRDRAEPFGLASQPEAGTTPL